MDKYVFLVGKLGRQHVHCRVIQVVSKVYRLFCDKCILLGTYMYTLNPLGCGRV